MILCPVCKENPRYKPPGGRCVGYCKKCWGDRARKWTKKNKDRVRDQTYKRKYGITLADFNVLYEAQGGVCAICREPELEKQVLSVDHNHTTKHVRGLLCGNCNRGIGNLKDSPAVLYRAIEYLNSYASS